MQKPLCVVLALACACGISGFGQDGKAPVSRSSSSPVVSDEAKAQAVLDYWTPDRMANARPMPIPVVDPTTLTPSSAATSKGPSGGGPAGLPTIHLDGTTEDQSERFPLSTGPDSEGEATGGGQGFNYVMPYNNFRTGVNNSFPYSTIGKLFFTIPPGASEAPGDYVCSGSVAIDSHTVVTARHCMYDITNHVWYSNWAFYPGWNNGSDSKLGGEWTINFAYTWVGSGNPNWYWDIGLLSIHDHDGKGCNNSTGSKVIGSYTGWLGWWYGENTSQVQWNIFGYPQASPFEGNYLYQDNAATGEQNPFGNSGIVEVGDPQTGGTSGGPWILGFDPNNGTDGAAVDNINGDKNLVNAVNSFKWTSPNLPLTINSAVFQSNNMNSLYNDYKAYGHCP